MLCIIPHFLGCLCSGPSRSRILHYIALQTITFPSVWTSVDLTLFPEQAENCTNWSGKYVWMNAGHSCQEKVTCSTPESPASTLTHTLAQGVPNIVVTPLYMSKKRTQLRCFIQLLCIPYTFTLYIIHLINAENSLFAPFLKKNNPILITHRLLKQWYSS